MATSQGRSTDDFSKMDKKIKRYSKALPPPLPKPPPPKKKKKFKNIDNITKLKQCACRDSIRGLQFRKPVTNQWGHKSINTLAANIGPCNLQLVLEQCSSFNQWDACFTAWPVVWTNSIFVWLCLGYPPIKCGHKSRREIRTAVELQIRISDSLTDWICLNKLFERCSSKWWVKMIG